MKATRSFKVTVLTVLFAVLMAGVALAETRLGSDDVALLDSADVTVVSLGLVREDVADLKISVRADEGNIASSHPDARRTLTTKRDWVFASGGTLSFKPDDTEYTNPSVTATFDANRNFSQNAQTVVLNVKVFAAMNAPLGASTPTITFAKVGTGTPLITLGAQIDRRGFDSGAGGNETEGDFANPQLPIAVSPRPASNLTASAPSTDAHSSIDVAWTRSPDHTDITSYIVTRNVSTTLPAIAASTEAGTTQGFTDTGLDASTEYCYTVKARFTSGGVDYDSEVVPVSPATVCRTTAAAPSTVTQTATFGQPIDGNGVVNIAKLGRTIPVKVTVDSGDESTGTGYVSIRWARSSTCSSAASNDTVEVYSSGGSNLGNQLRWEPGDQHWVFNLNTRDLGGTGCYRGFVYAGGTPVNDVISDGTKIGEFTLELRK